METTDKDGIRIARLIERLNALVNNLDKDDLCIHNHIDEFYYMAKLAELNILLDRFQADKSKLSTTIQLFESQYPRIFERWRKDVRWLNAYAIAKSVEILETNSYPNA